MKWITRVAWVAVVATYFLITLGGTVLATGSGLSCPDWPFCNGQLLSGGNYHIFLEQFHRYTAVLVSVLVVLLTVGILIWKRRDRTLLALAIAAPVLLIAQIGLGGLTVLMKLPPQIITAHLATALAIIAVVVTIAVLSWQRKPSKEHPDKTSGFLQLAITNALLTYILMLLGSYVTQSGAALACPGWPFCSPAPFAINTHLADINVLHRSFAVFVGLITLWTLVVAWGRRKTAPDQAWVALAAGVLFLAQTAVGGLIVMLNQPAFVAGLHLALATAVWLCLTLLAALAARQLRSVPTPDVVAKLDAETREANKSLSPTRQAINSYINLMKPHVTVLLLGVTLAAMAVAVRGMPSWTLVVPTLLGGALAAGSANCFNCYIDRDIDQVMTRTQRRSLPAGRVEPEQALRFGFVLAIGSFTILYEFVNLLSALLALSAILFYVFIYTIWLKRSTVQNIVIGGAAGAVPVLVGWAAVTGNVGIPAIWMFAIIFFWTPPHFWALSLLISKDYERAGVPMLPVVKGEPETRKQILLYSVFLLVLSLGLVAMQEMGILYLVGAILLGGGLCYYAIRLWLSHDKRWAKGLFWYSNLYLAAIFALMVVDRVLH